MSEPQAPYFVTPAKPFRLRFPCELSPDELRILERLETGETYGEGGE